MTEPTLKPWFGVATPHEDIRQGRLSEGVFAADLQAVDQGTAPDSYTHPEAFFAKTYLTTGLTNVLWKVSRALSGDTDAGDRILSLQTGFGGGKTHVLVALWHLVKHADHLRQSPACAELRAKLGDLSEGVRNIAVFTHQTCDVTQGRETPEGVHTRTLWGELALQLGGVEAYRRIEANDQSRTVPQGLFVDILRRTAPCLILLDELADYCVGAAAIEVGSTTLADQTISFRQQLTQAVQQVPGAVLVATLPASHLEVASTELGQELLNRLERRFGRMSADIKPVADEEIYEVVRRRLFESLGDAAEHEKTADTYLQMYQQHQDEVPAEASRSSYKERLLMAYPFHPSLIDALYLRWGSHSDFQRTRGVLMLLASVVGHLWQQRNTETQSQPLIQPCHLRWNTDALQAALTRLWGAAYESVVAADIIGEKANAVRMDGERGGEYLQEKMIQGLAASILLGSFGGQAERAGYSNRDLRLCVARPALNWGYTDGALLTLEDQGAFYLHTASAGSLGKRYWYGTRPNLTKLIVQYRNQLASQGFSPEVMEALQGAVRNAGSSARTWRVVVNPEADLPEQRTLTLLVMPPACAYAEDAEASSLRQRLLGLNQKCGSRDRLYRNTLLFLLPSSRGLTRAQNAYREVAALAAVRRDYWAQLDADDRKDLSGRLDEAQGNATESLGSAYTYVARIEGQEPAFSPLTDTKATFAEHLQVVWEHVQEEEWVLPRVGMVTLQEAGLVPDEGGIRVKDAIDAFLRYTDKPMIASRDAVITGLRKACQEKLIGLGLGVTPSNLQRRWCGEDQLFDPSEEGLWIIPPFEQEPPEEEPDSDEDDNTRTGTGTTVTGGTTSQGGTTTKIDTGTPTAGRQVSHVTIRGDVSLENWSELFRCFVNPAARMKLKQLRLGIEFELVAQDGQPLDADDPTLKAMRESANQLGLGIKEE